MVVLFEYSVYDNFNYNFRFMKNGNWIAIVWALTGFLILGFGLDHGYGWIGAVILISFLVYVFWSVLKR